MAARSPTDPPEFHLQVVPATVYKADDPGSTRTSSFVFDVAAICSDGRELTPVSAEVKLAHAGATVERQSWSGDALERITGVRYRILPDTPIAAPRRMFTLPEAFDLHLYFRCPQALEIDSADIRVEAADATGRRTQQMLRIPIHYYQQKTALIFPFRGRGHVGQDWVTNGGHGGGILTDFAVDVIGLDERYAPQTDEADENASAVGWGRDILAPARGTVIYARNDVPDNAHTGAEDSDAYSALPEPVMAYLGNSVIIDHGNSEYSVLAHMRRGSVRATVGEQVSAGQVIGALGNSGNSYGPHLHYQLNSGPRLFHDQSLPFRFENIDAAPLRRGTYFEAK